MKAVLIASALPADAGAPTEPASLRTLLDRSFLQHSLERLVDAGARELEVIVCDAPERIRDILGDGRRWGIDIRLHLSPSSQRVIPAVRRALAGHDGDVLLARGDRLWEIYHASILQTPVIYCAPRPDTDHGGAMWAGIARLRARTLRDAPDPLVLDQLDDWLLRLGTRDVALRAARLCVGSTTTAGWLGAQRAALEGRLSRLHFGGREVEPGVWLSRNVSLAPSVKVQAPVYVGEDCRVEDGVELGPGAVIGAGSVIARGAQVTEALVEPGSFVGESVSLDGVAVKEGIVMHARLGLATAVPDSHLIGSVRARRSQPRPGSIFARLGGALAAAVSLPAAAAVFAWLRLARRARLTRREIVRLPAELTDPGSWQTTTLWQLESLSGGRAAALVRLTLGLLAIAQGKLDLVGVTPRTRDEIDALPIALREAYLAGRPGFVTEADVTLGRDASDEERLLADLTYLVARSARRDLGLLLEAAA